MVPSPTLNVEIPIRLLEIFPTYTLDSSGRLKDVVPSVETPIGSPLLVLYLRRSPVFNLWSGKKIDCDGI